MKTLPDVTLNLCLETDWFLKRLHTYGTIHKESKLRIHWYCLWTNYYKMLMKTKYSIFSIWNNFTSVYIETIISFIINFDLSCLSNKIFITTVNIFGGFFLEFSICNTIIWSSFHLNGFSIYWFRLLINLKVIVNHS